MNFRNNRLVLLILSIVCIFLIGVTSINDTFLTPLRSGVGFFLTPISAGVNIVGKAIYNNITRREALETALDENSELQNRIDILTEENTRLLAENFELERLRKLYALDTTYNIYTKVGARVIAKETSDWFQVFRIDKGTNDGIAVDMNVIAGGGLVGIVTDVGSNYATVRSIIDDISRVSAMAMQSGALCLVSGDLTLYNEGRLLLSDIAIDSDIKEGDMIVTSNISTKYLPNILIGYATDITIDSSRLTKSGYIIPTASFDTLQEVLVITDLKMYEENE